MSHSDPVTVVLAEDDPGHARLISKNLRRANITNEIVSLRDGQKVLDYLYGTGEYEGNEHCGRVLILLDLNMPVLGWLPGTGADAGRSSGPGTSP